MKSNEAERQLRDTRGGDDSERCGGGEMEGIRQMERDGAGCDQSGE